MRSWTPHCRVSVTSVVARGGMYTVCGPHGIRVLVYHSLLAGRTHSTLCSLSQSLVLGETINVYLYQPYTSRYTCTHQMSIYMPTAHLTTHTHVLSPIALAPTPPPPPPALHYTVRRQAEVTCGHSDPSSPTAVLGGLRADRSKWDVAPEKIILEHRQAVTGVKAIFGVLTGMLLLVSVVTRCRCWCCHSGKGKSEAKGHVE